MALKKAYYYLFYSLYKLFEGKSFDRLAKIKSGIIIMGLEIWVLFSLNNYICYFTGDHSKLQLLSIKELLTLSLIIISQWYMLIKDSTWKDYVEKFERWPERKKTSGYCLVVLLILFITAMFLFSFYLNPPPGGLKW